MAADSKYTLLPIYDSEKEQTHALFDGAPFVDLNVSAYSKEDFKSIFTYKSAFSDDRRLDRLQGTNILLYYLVLLNVVF